jgi:hypothetical protein
MAVTSDADNIQGGGNASSLPFDDTSNPGTSGITNANIGNPGMTSTAEISGGSDTDEVQNDNEESGDMTTVGQMAQNAQELFNDSLPTEFQRTNAAKLQLEEEEIGKTVDPQRANRVVPQMEFPEGNEGDADTATQTGADFIGGEEAGEGTAGNIGDWPEDTGDDTTGRLDTTYTQ